MYVSFWDFCKSQIHRAMHFEWSENFRNFYTDPPAWRSPPIYSTALRISPQVQNNRNKRPKSDFVILRKNRRRRANYFRLILYPVKVQIVSWVSRGTSHLKKCSCQFLFKAPEMNTICQPHRPRSSGEDTGTAPPSNFFFFSARIEGGGPTILGSYCIQSKSKLYHGFQEARVI